LALDTQPCRQSGTSRLITVPCCRNLTGIVDDDLDVLLDAVELTAWDDRCKDQRPESHIHGSYSYGHSLLIPLNTAVSASSQLPFRGFLGARILPDGMKEARYARPSRHIRM
jgi:hypothetical protein